MRLALANSLSARAVLSGVGAVVNTYNPQALFSQGEQGFWLDPSDLSTMFQDAEGTIPVTTSGQPVGRILDKSGRNNHFQQTVDANRPIYQSASGLHKLTFNGSTQSLVSATNLDLSGTDKVTVWAGVLKASDAAVGILCEHTTNLGTNNGSFLIAAPLNTTGSHFSFDSKGTAFSAHSVSTNQPAPVKVVLTGQADISGDIQRLFVNGTLAQLVVTDQGTGNYASAPFHIGSRAGSSLRLNGEVHSIIVRGAATANLSEVNSFVASRSGVTI